VFDFNFYYLFAGRIERGFNCFNLVYASDKTLSLSWFPSDRYFQTADWRFFTLARTYVTEIASP